MVYVGVLGAELCDTVIIGRIVVEYEVIAVCLEVVLLRTSLAWLLSV